MGPLRIVDRHASDQKDDLAYWLSKTPEERVEAVEFLRRQCLYAAGKTDAPRMEKVLTLAPRAA